MGIILTGEKINVDRPVVIVLKSYQNFRRALNPDPDTFNKSMFNQSLVFPILNE